MSKVFKVWGLAKCDTTMKAVAYLKEKEFSVSFTDYSVTKPTILQIEQWALALGGWEKMINRSGYTWRGLDNSRIEGLDIKSASLLSHEFTSMIRRPLIEHADGTVTAGFAPKIKALFG